MKATTEKVDELRQLGLFVAPDFFPTDLCRELRSAVKARPAEAATIMVDGFATVNASVRRAGCCDILDHALNLEVAHRLSSILPMVAAHYGVSVTDHEAPQIVSYPVGGFYRPHVDSSDGGCGLEETDRRKVSCVVFLNGSGNSHDKDGFVGGALAFFRLAADMSGDNCKTLLYPVPGLLVAFRSNVYHEVQPVNAGERFTLVTWFR